MAAKRYTLVLADGFEDTFARKDGAVRAGEKSGQAFTVFSPAGQPVYTGTVEAEERPLEDGEQLPGDTRCKKCSETLDEHTWSPSQAATLCADGREFEPVEDEDEQVEDLIGAPAEDEPEADEDLIGEEPELEFEETEAPAEESTTADAEDVLEHDVPTAKKPVDIAKMKAKIAMMLAKAESTTFPEERDTFNAAAEKLMIRLGISIAELESVGERKQEEIVEVKRTYPGNYSISYIPFVHYVAQGFGHITILQQRTAGLARNAFVIGHKSDVETFLQLLDSLELQVKSALRQWQKDNIESRRGLTDMQKYLQHRSFIEGFGQRVGERLHERRTVEEETVSTGTALVLVGKDERVSEWIKDTYGETKGRATHRNGSSIGYHAGRASGEKASLGEKGIKGTKGELEK